MERYCLSDVMHILHINNRQLARLLVLARVTPTPGATNKHRKEITAEQLARVREYTPILDKDAGVWMVEQIHALRRDVDALRRRVEVEIPITSLVPIAPPESPRSASRDHVVVTELQDHVGGVALYWHEGYIGSSSAQRLAAAHGGNPKKDWPRPVRGSVVGFLRYVKQNMATYPTGWHWHPCGDAACPYCGADMP